MNIGQICYDKRQEAVKHFEWIENMQHWMFWFTFPFFPKIKNELQHLPLLIQLTAVQFGCCQL